MATWTVTSDVGQFEEAVEAHRERVPMTAAEVVDMTAEERRAAFWVAGTHEAAVVQTIHQEIERALAEGLSLDEFKKNLAEKLQGQHALGGAHLETVFRNAVQSAYNAGRWYQLTDPDVTAARPFWMFDAVLDTRTTPLCKDLNGTIKAHDDPFWLTHWCPLHHRCRSGVRALRTSEVERRGGVTPGGPPGAPSEGFGRAPPLRGEDPRPPPTGPKKVPTDPRIEQVRQQREQEALRAAAAEAQRDQAKLEARKREDPVHWEPVYVPKYGPEAGPAVAWGRAMQERGLALAPAEAKALHADLARAGILPDAQAHRELGNLFPRIERLSPGASTLGEALADLEAALADLEVGTVAHRRTERLTHELRTSAALIGHRKSIVERETALVRAPLTVAAGTTAAEAERRRAEFDRALGFYDLMADASLKHPTHFAWYYGKNLRGRYEPSRRRMVLNARRRGRTLVHEWAHGLEHHNPELLEASLAFRAARTAGLPEESLRLRFPGAGYEAHEMTVPDDFFHPYVGRDYGGGATEVLTMAAEEIWAGGGALLLAHDPDHFHLVLGQLAGDKAWPSGR
jgi:SPP1 gp7 family putative phage head morphogenesis protein